MSDLENQSLRPVLPFRYRVQHALGSVIGRRFDHLLDGIEHGQLSLTWPDGHTTQHGNRSEDPSMNAHIILHNFKPVQQIMSRGQLGFAEGYLRGDWTTDSLRNLFSVVMRLSLIHI